MIKIKKRYYFIVGLLVLLYFPVNYYVKVLGFYDKFHSGISLQTDSIFREPKPNSIFMPQEYNEISRLYYLCKVWGFLKYYHENVRGASHYINIDDILLESIPKAIKATDKKEFCEILSNVISSIQLSPLNEKNPYPNMDDYTLINNKWMNDTVCLDSVVVKQLKHIFCHHSGKSNPFIFNKRIMGNISLKDEREYDAFNDDKVRLLGLFRYWNVINYFYVYKNKMDENWDAVLYNTIPRFQAANSSVQYRKEIYRLTNQLRDTHASFPPTIDTNVFGPYRPNFRMKLINDTFIISSIRIPHFKKENINIGDIVLRIDNQDVRPLCDSLSHFVCGGNKWSNQSFQCNAVLSRMDSTSVFTLLRGEDTLTVQTKNYRAYTLFKEQRKMEQENEKEQLYRWINDSIAYLDLCSATPDNFDKNFKPIRKASAIILDIRNYPDLNLILNLTEAFVPPNSFFAYCTYPDTRFPGMLRYTKSSSDDIGDKNYYKGKVVILIDEWTQSYSEYVTMALQVNPRSVTVGNNSSGADGNVSLLEFPGGIETLFSGIGIYYPDFSPTQRIGVRVDHIVEPTVESIKNNIDLAYERAIEIAKWNTY